VHPLTTPLGHLKYKVETNEPNPLPESRTPPAGPQQGFVVLDGGTGADPLREEGGFQLTLLHAGRILGVLHGRQAIQQQFAAAIHG